VSNQEEEILKKLEKHFIIENQKKCQLRDVINQYFYSTSNFKLTSSNQRKKLENSLDEILSILGYTFNSSSKIDEKNPIIIINHIGIGKLFKININKIDTSFKRLINDDPFHFIVLGPYLICKKFNLNLYCVFTEFKHPVCDLFKKMDYIQIDRFQKNNYSKLKSEVQNIIESDENAAICIFPEGGTTGKRKSNSIYSLEEFKPGFLKLARELSLNIITGCQVFNQKGHLVVKCSNTKQNDYRESMQRNIDLVLYENDFDKWL